MDVNMDLKYKNEYEFLDLSGLDLDDNERQRLRTYLRSNTSPDILKLPWDVGQNDCNDNKVLDQEPETPKSWQNYGTEGEVIKYLPSDTSSPMMMQTTMPQTHMFPTVVLAYHNPNDWQNNLYVPGDMSIPYTTGGMTYSPYMNPAGNENQEIHPPREGGRRNSRGRGGKRESYNRNNQNNDVPTQYFPVQCVSDQYTSMYCPTNYPEHTMMSQQHPAVGQPVFLSPQQIYPQQPIHPQSHTNYTQYHQSQTNIKYNRQSQSLQSQMNGESLKSVPKSYEKRGQNVHSKPFRQQADEDDNLSQTIMTTFIVKNSNMEQSQNNTDNIAASKNNNNNSNKVAPVNVKIKHNIVQSRNESYKGTEKKEGPCVNIKSSIEIEQNGDNNEEFENETVSRIQTTVLKTHSKPATKPVEVESEVKSEDPSPKKLEEVIIPTIASVPSAPSVPSVASVPSVPSVASVPSIASVPTVASVALPAPEVNTLPTNTWASILKKGNTDTPLTPVATKPTAFINPMNISSASPSEETNTSQKTLSPNASKITQNKPGTPNQETQDKNVDSSHTQSKSVHVVTARDHDFDDPVTYRMGEFFLSYQMDKQTVSLLPRGLTNRSNYCYINSILQALLACPPFYNLLMALPYSKTNLRRSSRTPLIDNMTKFVHEFTPLSEAARMPRKDRVHKRNEDTSTDVHSGVPFEPSYVYTMLKNISSAGVFSIEGRQEDAEEFLSCLLNGISDEMLEVMKLVDSDKSSNNNPNTNLNPEEEEWQVMGPKNKGSVTRCTDFGRTPLSDIFRGQLRSRVHRAGEQPTDYVQPFFTLQLDIEKAESVKSAFEILVGKDQLEGMTCSKTKQQIEAWKQVTLEELPVILVLHLKWFDYKLNGCSKILKKVEFPVDLKVDSKFLSPNASKKFTLKQKQYKLFAVTYHDGKEATKGHYVTDAFHVGYGGWVRYDDSSLKGISEGNVLHPQLPRVPYLLYYRRCDTIGNNLPNVTRSR